MSKVRGAGWIFAAIVVSAFQVGGARAQTVLSGNLTADNAFYAYLSTSASTLGTLIGSGNNWGQTFSLTPTTLAAGTTYYLNVEVINYGGPGSFIGEFSLSDSGASFANGTQSLTTDTTHWVGGYNSGNSAVAPQPWVTPTGGVFAEGANGVGPWGTRGGVANTTQWIWASDSQSAPGGTSQSGPCGLCTVDFSTTITSAVPEPATHGLMLGGLVLMGIALRRKMLVAGPVADRVV